MSINYYLTLINSKSCQINTICLLGVLTWWLRSKIDCSICKSSCFGSMKKYTRRSRADHSVYSFRTLNQLGHFWQVARVLEEFLIWGGVFWGGLHFFLVDSVLLNWFLSQYVTGQYESITVSPDNHGNSSCRRLLCAFLWATFALKHSLKSHYSPCGFARNLLHRRHKWFSMVC